MADFAEPTLGSLYNDMVDTLKDRDISALKWLDGSTDSNLPSGVKRWNAMNNYFEKYNGITWSALTNKYMIDVDKVDGCSVNDLGVSTTDLWSATKVIAELGTKLTSTSYTASDILTKIKTVDGAGSGLDADLLDGLNATSTNTVSTVVSRDTSGNFSAGTITAALTGNASTASTLLTPRTINGVSFNGSSDINLEDRMGASITSSATISIGVAGLGNTVHISGNTSITSLGTATVGTRRTLIFDDILTLTHSVNIVCPSNTSIVTTEGTVVDVVADTPTIWRVLSITNPSVSFTEIGYLDGVTSNIQIQLENLAQAITVNKSLAIIMLGQSNAISRSPKVTTQYPVRLKTFNLGSQHGDYSSGNIENATPESKMASLVPFSEFARNEESWAPGLGSTINQYRYDEVMFYAAGIGARAYRKLKSGNGVYGEMLVADRNFRSLAKHQIVDRLYILDHGEADAVGIEPSTLLPETPVSKTDYLSIITQWRENIITDTKLQQGNSSLDVPIFLISSMNYAGVNIETTTSYKQVQNAQLEAGLTVSGMYMIGAKYQFDFETDQVHITGLGKRFYAEKAGHVYNKILINGYWKPMHIETVSSPNANTVLATFYIPENGNLVIDTATIKSTELTHTGSKYGFELFQDGVKNPITNVTVSGKVATITTQNAISGTVKELRIAQLNSTGLILSSDKNRSNIRSDSNIQTSIHNSSVKLYDWAVPQSKLL